MAKRSSKRYKGSACKHYKARYKVGCTEGDKPFAKMHFEAALSTGCPWALESKPCYRETRRARAARRTVAAWRR